MTARWPVVIVRPGLYAHEMGIVQAFEYQVRKPSAAQVAMQRIAATRPGAWFFARTLHHIDRVLLRLSQGQVTLPGVVAGIPVLTVTTTGARTGQRRTAPAGRARGRRHRGHRDQLRPAADSGVVSQHAR
jgi:hypothetical protein